MLHAIGAPLTFRDFAEYVRTLVQQFVDDSILRRFLEILEGVLYDPSVCINNGYHRRHRQPTWTTREPVSWHASEAHLPFKDLLTLSIPISKDELPWCQAPTMQIWAERGGTKSVP